MDLIEVLLSNERYQLTFGAFEYNPHNLINKNKKVQYRKFLDTQSTFK